MSISLHRTRPIRFLSLWEPQDWKIKLYGICEFSEHPDDAVIAAAKQTARKTLPRPAQKDERYGTGFVVVHQAAMFNQIIVDWWERENELRHRVFKAEPEAPLDFKEITHTGEAFCVWELRVIGFERDAWVQHVLSSALEAGLGHYLHERLNEEC